MYTCQTELHLCLTYFREKFDSAVASTEIGDQLKRTRQLTEGIQARLDLLLHVNISPADNSSITRTVSQCLEAIKIGR